VSDLVAQCESHLMRSGLFDRVNWHEPKSSPGVGVTAATWFTATTPVRSGLVSTTVRVELLVRMYMPMLREPMDDIDPAMMRALDVLMRQYSGDFTLGGEVRNVDLLGEHGTPLQARSGYLRVDSTLYRVVDITLPLIVNDLWEQAP
jgi:hypothetical protein